MRLAFALSCYDVTRDVTANRTLRITAATDATGHVTRFQVIVARLTLITQTTGHVVFTNALTDQS